MGSWALRVLVVGLIFLCLGIAGSAAVFALMPSPGSPPGIFDTFDWDSMSNGYWHASPYGGTASINGSRLTLAGHTVELDRRLQTDPYDTVVAVRVRGLGFDKLGFGISGLHSANVGMEFDSDGIKCGYGSDEGWIVPVLKGWTAPPTRQWFYLVLSVRNPYPTVTSSAATGTKPIGVTCSAYDGRGRLLNSVTATRPPPNAKYPGFDEVYLRTWDSKNRYQVDWLYAGPPSGSPLRHIRI
jgi:hypothetical protein